MAISSANEEILNYVSSENFLFRSIINRWNFRDNYFIQAMPLEQNRISNL